MPLLAAQRGDVIKREAVSLCVCIRKLAAKIKTVSCPPFQEAHADTLTLTQPDKRRLSKLITQALLSNSLAFKQHLRLKCKCLLKL